MELDIEFYKNCYKELKIHNAIKIKNHWNTKGIRENRLGSLKMFKDKYPNFCYEKYRKNNPNLNNMDDHELMVYFWNNGIVETDEKIDNSINNQNNESTSSNQNNESTSSNQNNENTSSNQNNESTSSNQNNESTNQINSTSKSNTYKRFYEKFPDFNVDIYKQYNNDLKHLHERELMMHFWKFGHKENRIYKLEINNQQLDIPKVLVIMPTYNRPTSCIKVINQMINQTYNNFDLLVIDDGSIESNYSLLEKGVNEINKSNVILKRNSVNMKIPKTLNVGLNHFLDNNYDYVSWISDDNTYYDNFIKVMVEERADFCYTNVIFENQIYKTKNQHYLNYKDANHIIDNFIGLYAFMWSKEAVKKIGMHNEELFCVEDLDYFIRSFALVSNIKFNKTPTMEYILHNSSLYQTRKKEIDNLASELKLISKTLLNNTNKLFMCFSNKPWNVLYERTHQICRFFSTDFLKVFVTNENIIKFEKKYNLLVIPFKFRQVVFNLAAKFDEKIIYYTDSRLFDEVNRYNSTFKILFDLIDVPNDELLKSNLEKSIINANRVMYSHPKFIEILKDIYFKKEYYYISNGCDNEHFSKAKQKIRNRPNDFPQTNKQILGYYGSFDDSLDYDLIKKYADEGNYHVVMICVFNDNFNSRFSHNNITWLNNKSYEELPYYLSWFDVCFMPFKDSEINKYNYLSKLWEYKASGKKIINSCVKLEDSNIINYHDVILQIKNMLQKNIIENNNCTNLNDFITLLFTEKCDDNFLIDFTKFFYNTNNLTFKNIILNYKDKFINTVLKKYYSNNGIQYQQEIEKIIIEKEYNNIYELNSLIYNYVNKTLIIGNKMEYNKPVIILFSMIDYNFRIQRHQHICKNLANIGYKVFYLKTSFNKNFNENYITNNLIEINLN
jgi:glycosyltransferase involved in cell wall biosynthesis